MILSASEGETLTLAVLADEIFEVSHTEFVNAVSTHNGIDDMSRTEAQTARRS